MAKSWIALLLAALAGSSPPADRVVHQASRYAGVAVHVVTVPAGFQVAPASARPGRTLEAFAQGRAVLAAINGGYFNHSDGWPVSHVRRAGHELTDPEHNRALAANRVLAPCLPRILNHRAEWRHLADGTWQVAFHDAPAPRAILDALQAGPRLLPSYDPVDEAFVIRDARGRVIRDGINAGGRATRSGLGLRADGSLALVSVGAPGLTLQAFRQLMASEGAVAALNLDGGSSTGLLWREGGRVATFHGGHGSAVLGSVLLVSAP